jgi:uncharacterized membrane protein HdeD (DUF308 family)
MEKKNSKNWYMFLLKGIILVVLSLFVFINPEGTLKAVAFYLGIGFFISGIVLVIRGIPALKGDYKLNWNVLEGAIDLILGFLLIVFPLLIASVIPVLIGLWAGFYSVLIIVDAVNASENRWMKIMTGIIIFILAIVLIFKPLLLGLTVMVWLGILLLISGILNIILSVKMKESLKKPTDTTIPV